MKLTDDQMREQLYIKLNDDFNAFISELIKGGRESIVNHIGELNTKYDMMREFEYFFPLEGDGLRAVLDKEHPLDFLYHEWDRCDDYKFDDMHWSITEIAEAAAKSIAQEQRKGDDSMTNVDALYYKMQSEYNELIEDIKTKSPTRIVEAAYEITYKQDILFLFEEENCTVISEEQAKILLAERNPLDVLYEGWMDTDVSVMDDLRDCVKTTCEKIADDFLQKNKGVISHESR